MALELKAVSKRIGADIHIHPTDLTLARGSFNVLLGTTLAGKTTLMHLMAGLDRPTAGTVRFDGRDVTGVRVQARNVAMVYQQFINYPNMTVFENIASPLRVARVGAAEIRRRVGEIAELMKLTPMLQRKPAELSGGQQQRTAMARALVKDADLVLLDEPLANLDYKLREELRDDLPKLFADRNGIIVYATTEPMEALLFGGTTATLHEGRVTQVGPTAHLYRHPVDLVTASVFSDPPINTAAVTKRGAELSLGAGAGAGAAWPATPGQAGLPDGPYRIGLRPHFVIPAGADRSPGPAAGRGMVPVDGHVLVTELSGSDSIVHFRLRHDGGGAATWVSQAHGIHALEVGTDARFLADMRHAMLFDEAGTLVGGDPPAGA